MIESSRYDHRLAWFVGDPSSGDYYDQTTGLYLGSWSKSQGNFIDVSRQNVNLFDLEQWKDRHEAKTTGFFGGLVEKLMPGADRVRHEQLSDPLQLPGKYVAFIGDSFCGHLQKDHYAKWNRWYPCKFRHDSNKRLAWTSLVIDGMKGYNFAHYGFGGRSWYYSWQKFWQHWKDRLHQLDLVVFVHSSADRINNAIHEHIRQVPLHDLGEDPIEQEAVKLYFTYIADYDFQRWCQQQYFRHIREIMHKVPQVHFFAFNIPSPETCEILPGMKFTTPLFILSETEQRVVRDKIKVGADDFRVNHFNEHNNRAMADIVLAAAADYRVGTYPVPHHDFQLKDSQNFLQVRDQFASEDIRYI